MVGSYVVTQDLRTCSGDLHKYKSYNNIDKEDHISSLGNEYFQDLLDSKIAAMMAKKQRLMDHHSMITILKKNLQPCGLSNQLEGMNYLLHVFLFDKGLVAFGVERNFKQFLFRKVGKLINWKRKWYLSVVQMHEKRHGKGRKVLTLQCQKVTMGNAWKLGQKQVYMHEHKVLGETIHICKNDFKFQFNSKRCITELGTRKYKDSKEMEDRLEDMEQNPEAIISYSEIAS
jgi:hypothetical protein